jgi:hypothetical protein
MPSATPSRSDLSPRSDQTPRSNQRPAFAGLAFVVFFLVSVVVSNPPADNASDAKWIANYTGHSNQFRHAATGVLLVLAALSLVTFLASLWRRIADRRGEPLSPVALVVAAVSGACIAAGGIVMATISFSELTGKYPLPSGGLLRFTNDLGFGLAGVAGIWAAAVAVALLSVQAHAGGLFSRRMLVFSEVVAAVQILSPLFVPILALLIWAVVVAVGWLRSNAPQPAVPAA